MNKAVKCRMNPEFVWEILLIDVIKGDSDLMAAMKLIAESGKGPEKQIPSMGCNIKWFK